MSKDTPDPELPPATPVGLQPEDVPKGKKAGELPLATEARTPGTEKTKPQEPADDLRGKK